MTKRTDPDRVDGVEVIERNPARMKNIRAGGGHTAELKDVDEVLLADDRVIYQCRSRNDSTCERYFASVIGAVSHLKTHSPKYAERRAQVATVAPEVEVAEPKERKEPKTATPKTPEEQAVALTNLKARMRLMKVDMQSMLAMFDTLVEGFAEVNFILSQLEVTDKETAAKARKFDQLRGTLLND